MSFDKFNLADLSLAVLDALHIEKPTPVQAKSIPAIAQGRDVMVTAKTGSGKSLAYVLPLVNLKMVDPPGRNTCVLIIVPSRELVSQLATLIRRFTQSLANIKLVELAGGGSVNPQLMQLRGGADFVVATPGRLLDVVARNGLDLGRVTTLVLDEADRLLDFEFQDETNEVLEQLPPCQRLFLSATFSKSVNAKSKWLLKDPLVVNLSPVVAEIQQRAIQINMDKRIALLEHLLSTLGVPQALVFVANRNGAEKLTAALNKMGFACKVLHGRLSMTQRSGALAQLKHGDIDVLVATDLAARGIDVPSLPLVINYDLPRSTELYTHRIGRTGRAGEPGLAISFVDINSEAHFRLIEKRLDMSIEREQLPGFIPTDVLKHPTLVDGTGGIKGRRMSKKDKARAAANEQKPE